MSRVMSKEEFSYLYFGTDRDISVRAREISHANVSFRSIVVGEASMLFFQEEHNIILYNAAEKGLVVKYEDGTSVHVGSGFSIFIPRHRRYSFVTDLRKMRLFARRDALSRRT